MKGAQPGGGVLVGHDAPARADQGGEVGGLAAGGGGQVGDPCAGRRVKHLRHEHRRRLLQVKQPGQVCGVPAERARVHGEAGWAPRHRRERYGELAAEPPGVDLPRIDPQSADARPRQRGKELVQLVAEQGGHAFDEFGWQRGSARDQRRIPLVRRPRASSLLWRYAGIVNVSVFAVGTRRRGLSRGARWTLRYFVASQRLWRAVEPDVSLAVHVPSQAGGPAVEARPVRLAGPFPAPVRARLRRTRLAVAASAVILGTVVSLLRTTGTGALQSIWEEDARDILDGALNTPGWGAVGRPVAGYFVMGPRLIGEFATLFPISWAAAVLSLSSALLTALLALLVYCASAPFFPGRTSGWLARLLVSAPVLVVPAAENKF